MLPREAVAEFKEIYERVFKEKLTDEEASRRANRLIELYKAILRIPSGKSDRPST